MIEGPWQPIFSMVKFIGEREEARLMWSDLDYKGALLLVKIKRLEPCDDLQ